MEFKVLCSDLDGTLLSTKNDVSEFAISEIQRIKNKLRVVLVSARMPVGMYYLQERLGIIDQPIICYNGALILQRDVEIHSTTIPLAVVKEIYGNCQECGTDLGLYYKNEWYVPKTSERVEKEIKYTKTNAIFKPTADTIKDWESRNLGAHKIMLMGTKESSDRLMPILNDKFSYTLNLYRSNDTLIEVAPKSVSKLSAIKLILKDNETLQDVIAFGDNYNDISMLQYCGWGVAVENAREEVKEIADFTTLKNTENGVADYIRQHLVI